MASESAGWKQVNDDTYRVALAKIVAAIAPVCLPAWEGDLSKDKESFAKETVDIAEALMAEISKREAPK